MAMALSIKPVMYLVLENLFQILRIDAIDNINKFKLATVFASIKCLFKKNPGQVGFCPDK
jgi:hypothetical protein